MAEPHLDHPGEITWYAEQGPLAVLGPCDHACAHHLQRVVAWGPSLDRYELVRCDVPYGCNRTCRAWTDGYGRTATAWLNVKHAGNRPQIDAAGRTAPPDGSANHDGSDEHSGAQEAER